MRSALEWAQVRVLVADGVSEREIARRLGINRRTVARLAGSEQPPRYRRPASGSQLDPLEPVLRRLLEEWPLIKAPRVAEILRSEYGFAGSERLVREHLRRLRPSTVRPAQRTGYRPGQVLQLDWAEMPSRPMLAGRERRVYALIASLPFSGGSEPGSVERVGDSVGDRQRRQVRVGSEGRRHQGGVGHDEPVGSEDATADVGDLADRARSGGVEVIANRLDDVVLEITAGGVDLNREQLAQRLGGGDGAGELERLDDDRLVSRA